MPAAKLRRRTLQELEVEAAAERVVEAVAEDVVEAAVAAGDAAISCLTPYRRSLSALDGSPRTTERTHA